VFAEKRDVIYSVFSDMLKRRLLEELAGRPASPTYSTFTRRAEKSVFFALLGVSASRSHWYGTWPMKNLTQRRKVPKKSRLTGLPRTPGNTELSTANHGELKTRWNTARDINMQF
jgi:hypothetical protein